MATQLRQVLQSAQEFEAKADDPFVIIGEKSWSSLTHFADGGSEDADVPGPIESESALVRC
jgi:hypothetical protein